METFTKGSHNRISHIFGVVILLLCFGFSSCRWVDGTLDMRWTIRDTQELQYLRFYCAANSTSYYIGIENFQGKTFHLLMYHNASYFVPLVDKGDNTLKFPEVNTRSDVLGPHRGWNNPDVDSGTFFFDFEWNTTTFFREYPSNIGVGEQYFDRLYNFTFATIGTTFSAPLDGTPIVLQRVWKFIFGPEIFPIQWPFRAEELHPAPFAIMLAFYIVSFGVLLLFSKEQPLKSRGLVPFVSCVLQFLTLSIGILAFFPRNLQLPYQDVFYSSYIYFIVFSYFRYAPVLMIIFLSIWLGVRFVILVNVNSRKLLWVENTNQKVLEMRWYWKLVKLSGNWVVSPIMIISAYLLFSFYLSGCWIPGALEHYWFFAGVPVIIFTAVVVGFADLVTNFHRIRKCEFVQLWKEDVFWFRFELYIIVLGFILPWFVFWYLILSDGNFPTVYFINSDENGLIYAINTLSFAILYFWQVGFVLMITIIQYVRQRIHRKRQNKASIASMLTNAKMREMFRKHSKNGTFTP